MGRLWADSPYKLISTPTKEQTAGLHKDVAKIATEMALAHNLIVRNINAIYNQAEGVSEPEDIIDFLRYCQMAMEEVRTHHFIEEKHMFPAIAEYTGVPDIMEGNIEQHHAFESGVKRFSEYVDGTDVAHYDGKTVKTIIDEFAPALHQHLVDEIPTLLGLDKYGGDKLAAVWKIVDQKVLKEMDDMHRILPIGLGANDVTFENGIHKWPPLPFFMPYLTKYYFSRRYKGSWRFSPCDVFGNPRQLPFAPEI